MGNGPSELQAQPIYPLLLQGEVLVDQTFMHNVTIHHTTQHAYSKFRIIKFTHVDRGNEGRVKLKNRSVLQFCLEKKFQLNDLLKSACLPSKCRHPSVLCIYKHLLDPTTSSLYLVAEPSLPLSLLIKHCDFDDVLLGIRSLLAALDFVHRNLSLSHNNLRLSSIFLTSQSQWKLSGFEFSQPFSEMNKEITELLELLLHDGDNLLAASAYHRNYPYCYDIYSFSRLTTKLIAECLGSDCPLFALFLQVLHRSCMHPQPKVRIAPAQLLSHPIFHQPLLTATTFLEDYMTHTDEEKAEFFNTFRDKIAQHLRPELLCEKILPKCFDCTIFLDPPSETFISQLLHPYPEDQVNLTDQQSSTKRGLFSYSIFQRYVCPLLIGKFRLHERLTRLILLQHFSGYGHLLQECELKDTILQEVCLGVFDLYDPLSSLSLRTLGDLSTRLGAALTLNTLREIESRLRRENKFPPISAKSLTTDWPRAALFPEAAPKISRLQRELPLSEKRTPGGTNGTGLSLAQLASFSAEYNPDSNPQLMFPTETDDEDGDDGYSQKSRQPFSLRGNAHKIKQSNVVRADSTVGSIPCQLILNGCTSTEPDCDANETDERILVEKSDADAVRTDLPSTTSGEKPHGLRMFENENKITEEEQQIEQLLTAMEPKWTTRQYQLLSVSPLTRPKTDHVKNERDADIPQINRLTICDTEIRSDTTFAGTGDSNKIESDTGDGWDEAWDTVVD
ncbi:hypothetical protein D915_009688 [Fasciola hepatica]|uniref:Protein kinase domain-containing protein n=1 Tax=Fasciola hepatica TaxID=6192 RepID=A0A4E0QW28_FASHE|nr:hypothetical protein D915_009688 [Fasciola hepatica]